MRCPLCFINLAQQGNCDMEFKVRYSIGDMSRICNISKKALRYYDKINLINSRRQAYNNYRYYTVDSLLTVPVIKYYKQMGFTLDEMRSFIEGNSPNIYREIKQSFRAKLEALEAEQEKIRRRYVSVKDWYDLILEAEMVIDNNINDVSIKYIEQSELLAQQQTFQNNIEVSVINIDFTNFVEDVQNEITGPVMIEFSSFKDRIQNKEQKIRILQKTLLPCEEEHRFTFGGKMAVSCYHIGAHDNIQQTYRKIARWAGNKGYTLEESAIERYVTDYWTTKNSEQFVTEVIIGASRSTNKA